MGQVIRISDHIETKEFRNELKDVSQLLDKVATDAERVISVVSSLDESMKKGNVTHSKTTGAVKEVNKQLNQTTKSEIELDKINKKILDVQAKMIASRKVEAKTLEQLKQKQQEQNKITKLQVLANQALDGSYKQIDAALKLNIQKYQGLSKEQRENSKIGGKLLKTIQQQDKQLKKLDSTIGKSQRHVGNYGRAVQGLTTSFKSLVLSFGFIGGIALFAKVIRDSAKVTIDFSKSQSTLAATLGKTKDEITDLTADALRYGKATEFTASQVSDLQNELAKLGFTQTEIKNSTRAILDLASATGSDLASAAKVTGSAIRAFNLDATESERIASVLAVATTKSALAFNDYETALSTLAPVAKAFGFNVESTIALLGKLKDAGFDATSAATATRNIILNLADSNGKLAKALGQPVKSLDDFIPAMVKLRDSGVDLNTTLQLTDKRSVAAFNTFLNGAESAGELRDELVGVTEELQQMVDTKLDNFAGDVKKMTSAWEGLILTVEKGDGVIGKASRNFVQFITKAIQGLSQLDIAFTRESKMTEAQWQRVIDDMNGFTTENGKLVSDVISDYMEGLGDLTPEEFQKNTKKIFRGLQTEFEKEGERAETAAKLTLAYINIRKKQFEQEAIDKVEAEKKAQEELARLQKQEEERAKAEAEKRADEEIKAQQKLTKEKLAAYELEAETFINIQTDKLLKGQISETEYADSILRIQIELAKRQLEIANLSNEQRIEAKRKLLETEYKLEQKNQSDLEELFSLGDDELDQLYKDQLKRDQGIIDQAVKDHKKGEDQKIENTKRRVREEEEIEKAKVEALNEIGNGLFDFMSALREREIANIDAKEKYELELAGDNEEKKLKIQKSADRKRAEILRKQAISDKISALFQIGINTAKAIMAVAPVIPLMILMGIAGAIQAAIVAAKPIPQFKKGVKKFEGGPAIVGEEGKEALMKDDRLIGFTPDKPTVMNLPKDTTVLTHRETEEMLQYGGVTTDKWDELIGEHKKTRQMLASKEVRETNVTERGIQYVSKKGSEKTEYINRYMRY